MKKDGKGLPKDVRKFLDEEREEHEFEEKKQKLKELEGPNSFFKNETNIIMLVLIIIILVVIGSLS